MHDTLPGTSAPAQVHTNLGELIAFFYDQFLSTYGDPALASVATAAIINDLLAGEGAGADRSAA